MMQGVVNLRREATLTVAVSNSKGQLQAIDAVIVVINTHFWTLPILCK